MKDIEIETPGKNHNQEMPTWILMSIATPHMYDVRMTDKKWNTYLTHSSLIN